MKRYCSLMDNSPVRGTCMLMCPEQEIDMRQREGLIHILETQKIRSRESGTADRKKMVKMFTRSSAGRDLLRPEELRPPPVLKKTINYLLSVVVCETELPWSKIYVFVADRLRSVRQDMVVQQPSPEISITILEPIVKFYAYSSYRLCEEPLDVFDPHLNSTHLKESLMQLLICYDSDQNNELSTCREQMESLYGLLHLGDVDALYRMLSLRPTKYSSLSVVLRMSLAHFHNDYVTMCRLLCQLPPMLAVVATLHLPYIRRKALSVMNTAYSSKNLCYPLVRLSSTLLYCDVSEAAEDCRYYGLNVDDINVYFTKGSFNFSVKECKPKRLHFIDDSLTQISLPDLLLLTASDPEP